jgi:hypothetical protein
MEPTNNDHVKAELITIAGGVELEVTYQDGNKETVKVRQVPISKIENFIFALANESQAIELYCDRQKGWADTLSIESASAIADKGQELNMPFFAAWFRRQMKWRESQQPGGEGTNQPTPAPSPLGSFAPPSPTTTT